MGHSLTDGEQQGSGPRAGRGAHAAGPRSSLHGDASAAFLLSPRHLRNEKHSPPCRQGASASTSRTSFQTRDFPARLSAREPEPPLCSPPPPWVRCHRGPVLTRQAGNRFCGLAARPNHPPPLRPTACARAPATSLLGRPLAVLSYPGWLPSLVPKQRPPAPGSSPSVQTKHGGDMGETRVTSIAKGGSHPGILRPSPRPAAGAVDPDSCFSCPHAALAPQDSLPCPCAHAPRAPQL